MNPVWYLFFDYLALVTPIVLVAGVVEALALDRGYGLLWYEWLAVFFVAAMMMFGDVFLPLADEDALDE